MAPGKGSDGGDGPKAVRVTDRRTSSQEEETAAAPHKGGHYHADGTYHEHDHGEDETSAHGEPPVDFPTFILSLSTSALMHMGYGIDAASPGTPSKEHANLPLARQTIDLLSLLEQKTAGNLTGEEERLLSEVLFDLRMRFVKISGG